jgi:hypothetical protein
MLTHVEISAIVVASAAICYAVRCHIIAAKAKPHAQSKEAAAIVAEQCVPNSQHEVCSECKSVVARYATRGKKIICANCVK